MFIFPIGLLNNPVTNNTPIVFLSHGDNITIDETGKTINTVGTVSVSTTESKFGGSSFYFTGSGYLYIVKDTDLTFTANDFTWECWVYPEITVTPTAFAGIIGNARSDDGNFGLFLSIYDSKFQVRHWVDGSTNAISDQTITTDTWYHVAVTKNGTTIKIFVDGIEGIAGSTLATNTDGDFIIGSVYNNSGFAEDFQGYIDEIRLTKGLVLYSSNFTPPTQPFLINSDLYPQYNKILMNFEQNVIYDYYGNTVETVGNSTITTADKYFGLKSLYLDGIDSGLKINKSSINLESTVTPVWTIECWIYQETQVGRKTIFTNYNLPEGNQFNSLLIATTQIGSDNVSFNYTLPQNQWVHLAVVRDNDIISLFLDGVYIDSTTTTTLASANYNFIGCSPGDNNIGGEYFKGYIDDFRLTEEIARYTTNFTPPTISFAVDLTYSSDGDNNGVFYYRGRNNNTTTWSNPQASSNIVISASMLNGSYDVLVDKTDSNDFAFYTANVADSWVAVDLLSSYKLICNKYSIQNTSNYITLNWDFQGSNDATNWTTLHSIIGNPATPYAWVTNNVTNTTAWRHFRILMNGLDSTGATYLTFSEFELYGALISV